MYDFPKDRIRYQTLSKIIKTFTGWIIPILLVLQAPNNFRVNKLKMYISYIEKD